MLQFQTSPKKPSPLSFGSPRISPFRRPESPQARSSPLGMASTPPAMATPRPLPNPQTLSPERQPRHSITPEPQRGPSPSPSRPIASPITNRGSPARGLGAGSGGDPLLRMNPVQLREMRESFQVLDRDNDGQVTKDDVAEVLSQLGVDSAAASLAPYFHPSLPATVNLASYLHILSSQLSSLSSPSELLAAFAAFDRDDSGQIDIGDLRDALLHTAPEPGEPTLTAADVGQVLGDFSGRRAFKKGMSDAGNRGDVFRYTEFVGSINGAAKNETPIHA